MTDPQVLSVASEIFPLIKTGGLADVAGALPAALAAEGIAVKTLVPGYRAIRTRLGNTRAVRSWTNLFGGAARLLATSISGLDLLVLDAPHLFDRPGNPYTGPDGKDWPDNAQRFAALGRAGADVGLGLADGFKPDIVHAHDWQAGLTPAYLHYDVAARRPGIVFTVHNLAYQGQFPMSLLASLGLPPASYAYDGIEYYGTIGYLKAGLQLADRITTVSPRYATEIMGPEAGMGLDGLLRFRADAVSGILNGIDTEVWNPAKDALIAPFDGDHLEARAGNKAMLQERMDLEPDPDALLFGVVSRLSWQKGLDLLLSVLPDLLAAGGQLALVGSGDRALELAFTQAAERNPGRVGCILEYDESLAHLIQAGADSILVPSRYEPCGLTQLCALRYGAVPLVARVGGLADTVIDASEMAVASGVATGIQFVPVEPTMFRAALRRAAALFSDKRAWTTMQRNGMKTDVSWRNPARHYAALYRGLIAARRA